MSHRERNAGPANDDAPGRPSQDDLKARVDQIFEDFHRDMDTLRKSRPAKPDRNS